MVSWEVLLSQRLGANNVAFSLAGFVAVMVSFTPQFNQNYIDIVFFSAVV